MPTNAKKRVYKEREFGIYVLWKSLPPHFSGMTRDELESLGLTDPLVLEIAKIQSQTEFAKYFHIKDLGTLTDWNRRIREEDIPSPLLTTDFQKQCSNINQRIILPGIDESKGGISEENEIVFLLKKENALLREKLKLRVSKKRAIKSGATTPQEIVLPPKPEANHLERETTKVIQETVLPPKPEVSRSERKTTKVMQDIVPLAKPEANHLERETTKTIFQKIKTAFQK